MREDRVPASEEGVWGAAHVDIGSGALLGGRIQASTHFDAPMWRPALALDGRVILEEGKLRV